MNEAQLIELLDQLVTQSHECEWLEFKLDVLCDGYVMRLPHTSLITLKINNILCDGNVMGLKYYRTSDVK